MSGHNKWSKIINFFEKISGVSAVYIFGSASKEGSHTPEDIDLAVLFETEKTPDIHGQLKMRESLTATLKEEVDLIVLNTANPILRHQVLRGKLLVNNNRDAVNHFFVRTVLEYDDIKRIRKPIEKNILKGRRYG